jgi:hypothetical protein
VATPVLDRRDEHHERQRSNGCRYQLWRCVITWQIHRTGRLRGCSPRLVTRSRHSIEPKESPCGWRGGGRSRGQVRRREGPRRPSGVVRGRGPPSGASEGAGWVHQPAGAATEGWGRRTRSHVIFGHIPDPPAYPVVHQPSAPADLAAVGFQHAEDDAHGGGLAGAIGADEPEHLPLTDREGHVVKSKDVAIAPCQPS